MKYTDKESISKVEYFQLVGLLELARRGNEKQLDIMKAVISITGERDDMGFSADAVYSDIGADELLERLNITVSKES